MRGVGGAASEATPVCHWPPRPASQASLPTDYCLITKKVGRCRGSFPRWYYDPEEQICKSFVYGGCSGNKNNYLREEECRLACLDVKGGPLRSGCGAQVNFPQGGWFPFACQGVGVRAPPAVSSSLLRPGSVSSHFCFLFPRPLQGKASYRWALLLFLFPSPRPHLQPMSRPCPWPGCFCPTHAHPHSIQKGCKLPTPAVQHPPGRACPVCVQKGSGGTGGERGRLVILRWGGEGQADDGPWVLAGLCWSVTSPPTPPPPSVLRRLSAH